MIWEYLVEVCGPTIGEEEDMLNHLGQEGWECFRVHHLPNSVRLYMKRSKIDSNWIDKVNGFMRPEQPDFVPLSTDSQAVTDAKKFSNQVKALTSDEKKRIEDVD